jgi:hypothetical protein
MARKVKKLYFSVTLSRGGASTIFGSGAVFPCTNFRATPIYSGDNNRAVLEDFAPIAATDPPSMRSPRDVSAWFQLNRLATVGTGATPPTGFLVDFVTATTAVAGITVIGGFGSVPAGMSTLGVNHFAVRVRPVKLTTGNFTALGTLYVQRQHSIEV